MIISKTPMRLSFVGGGSDLPSFYRDGVGAVLSTSIDKFVYVTINKRFEPGIRLSYSKTEEVLSVAEIEHRIVKATLGKLGMDGGVEITSIADIPSRGSGLGSSSSFTVGLLHALYAYQGRYLFGAIVPIGLVLVRGWLPDLSTRHDPLWLALIISGLLLLAACSFLGVFVTFFHG